MVMKNSPSRAAPEGSGRFAEFSAAFQRSSNAFFEVLRVPFSRNDLPL
jgi:hypothetical protein